MTEATLPDPEGSIGHGGVLEETRTEIAYLPTPDADEWAAAMADADKTRGRVLYLYSPERMQNLVTKGELAIYEIWHEAERLGSMALERVNWNNETIINVVWLRVRPGSFTNGVKAAVRTCWKQVASGFGNPRFTVQGRPGWEHVLVERGLEPRLLSSVWVFESERL